jgi:hypothetical protein
MKENIKNISEYIRCISRIIADKNEDGTVVFRGEVMEYPTHCQPNLFRGDYLKRNKYFEKNLFDEMTSNKLTNGENYLEKAIDAQHGGFPSRLLDVTYNCLVALYFATTPDPSKPEYYIDDKDGVVYVYFIEKLFCPSGDNINTIYDSIVKRDKHWFSDRSIFQKNHKLIDHIKTNKRIIAQQGAFILFQGDLVSPIPESDYKVIYIDHNSKSEIRRDLKSFFGIHTGSIYPEPNNLVKDITSKSYIVNCNDFNVETELDLVINNFERELEFFCGFLIHKINEGKTEVEVTRKITKIEEIIFSYKNGIEEIREEYARFRFLDEKVEQITKEVLEIVEKARKIEMIVEKYNEIIMEFYEAIRCHISKFEIEISIEELMIGDK